MGFKYYRRPRLERIKPPNEFVAYALGHTGSSDKLDDPEPIIKSQWNKAEAQRKKALDRIDEMQKEGQQ